MSANSYNWAGHDHSECSTSTEALKLYDHRRRRYTLHDFKSGRYVEAVTGTEEQAEARCIALDRQFEKATFFYKSA